MVLILYAPLHALFVDKTLPPSSDMARPLLPIVGIFSFVLFFKMSVLLGYSPICPYHFSVKFAIWGRPIFRQNHGGRLVLSQWLDRTAKVLNFCSCLVFGSSRTSSTGTTGRCDCDCSVVPVVHCADTHTTPSYYPRKHDIEPETLGWKIVFNGVFRAGKSRMIECPCPFASRLSKIGEIQPL